MLPTMDTYELLDELGFYAGNDDLQDRVVMALPDNAGVRRHPLSLAEEDRLVIGWDDFATIVKHRVRYLMFPESESPSIESEVVAPAAILGMLGDLVQEHDILAVLPTGTDVYRVRVHLPGVVLSSAAAHGPPPRECARYSNRMSPAGISLFYGSLEQETALAETYVRHDGNPAEATIAVFTVTADIPVLDLTAIPSVPSIFADDELAWRRPYLTFLHRFVHAITQPIVKDGREHVDYVPSQIVTEYFRFRFRDRGGQRVRGILYSAAVPGGRSCVLFLSDEDFADDRQFGRSDRSR